MGHDPICFRFYAKPRGLSTQGASRRRGATMLWRNRRWFYRSCASPFVSFRSLLVKPSVNGRYAV